MTLDVAGTPVTICIEAVNRVWWQEAYRHGQRGIVQDYVKKYIPRIKNDGLNPGIYPDFEKLIVEFEGSRHIVPRIHIKELSSENYKPPRAQPEPLPDSKFWEGDQVKLCTTREPYVVTKIKYGDEITYNLSKGIYTGDGCWATVLEDGLELIDRGPVWNFYHGKRLLFTDIVEEVRFHTLIGQYQKRNLESRYSVHDRVFEAVRLLSQGDIDTFILNPEEDGISSCQKVTVFYFTNRVLGERVAEATRSGCSFYSALR